MARTRRSTPTIEDNLKPGWYMSWQGHIFRIVSRNLISVEIEDISDPTYEKRTVRIDELYMPESHNGSAPVFAPTLDKLRAEIDILYPVPEPTASTTIPDWALKKRRR